MFGFSRRTEAARRLIPDRELVALNAVCLYLGWIVKWLQDRQQLQCPCHGSRFDITGEIRTGPCPRPLERLKLYVDGVLAASGNFGVKWHHGYNLVFGAHDNNRNDGATYVLEDFSRVLLDDIRIYNYALAPSEVRGLPRWSVSSEIGFEPASIAGLVADNACVSVVPPLF